MKTTAAVVIEPGKPIEVEELTLDGPRDNEVLIQYLYGGLCHSDIHIAIGDTIARLPMVLGHEGAGNPGSRPRRFRACARRSRRVLIYPVLWPVQILLDRPPVGLRYECRDA